MPTMLWLWPLMFALFVGVPLGIAALIGAAERDRAVHVRRGGQR